MASYINSSGAREHVKGVQVGVAQQPFNVGSMKVMPLPVILELAQDPLPARVRRRTPVPHVAAEQKAALPPLHRDAAAEAASADPLTSPPPRLPVNLSSLLSPPLLRRGNQEPTWATRIQVDALRGARMTEEEKPQGRKDARDQR